MSKKTKSTACVQCHSHRRKAQSGSGVGHKNLFGDNRLDNRVTLNLNRMQRGQGLINFTGRTYNRLKIANALKRAKNSALIQWRSTN